MSFDGHAASSSGCAIRPKEHGTGLAAFGGRTRSLCTLGAMPWVRLNIGSRVNREVHARFWERPGGETPPGDSTSAVLITQLWPLQLRVRSIPNSGHRSDDSAYAGTSLNGRLLRACNALTTLRVGSPLSSIFLKRFAIVARMISPSIRAIF